VDLRYVSRGVSVEPFFPGKKYSHLELGLSGRLYMCVCILRRSK